MRRLLALLLIALPAPALAWGDYAHRLTADIALAQLTPRARAEVRRILGGGGGAQATPECAMTSLQDASVWPDCIRQYRDRFAFSYPWHYQNIDICKPFDATAKCPEGDCVTAQIPLQLKVVADRRAPAAERARALAFLVHFVGDMHQPLHVGEHDDKGGNDVRAAYGAKAPERMNLHRIWDSELAERALTEPPAITARGITPAERRQWAQGDVADWARESWEMSRTIAYPRLPGRADACAVPAAGPRPVVDEAYVAAASAGVRIRVGQAGVRLAMVLNRALAR